MDEETEDSVGATQVGVEVYWDGGDVERGGIDGGR
jgi:hypothetical protein